jgi:aspartyl-tRNA(Asn)/glutamyl-tRNA(Gln) amidotransferase subunit A
MAVDKATVAKIASLARLRMSDEELERMAPELNKILSFVDQLGEVDTSAVEPMTAVIPNHLRLRDDVVDADPLTGGGKKVGIPREYRMDGMDEDVAKAWDEGIAWMKDAGAEIVDISLPHTKYALPAYYIIAPAEASSNLARYDGVRYGLRELPEGANLQDMYAATRAAGFGDEVKRRIMIGTYVLSAGFYDAYFTQACKVRTLIAQDFSEAFEKVDTILAPTTPTASFALGDKLDDPLAMYLNDVFSVPASLAGLPAMSVPSGLNREGLPLGLQIIGKAFDEQGVLNAGLAIEHRAQFSAKPARWW